MSIRTIDGQLHTNQYWVCDCTDEENILTSTPRMTGTCAHCLASEASKHGRGAPIISVIKLGYPITELTDFDSFCKVFKINGIWEVAFFAEFAKFVGDDPGKASIKNMYEVWVNDVILRILDTPLPTPLLEWKVITKPEAVFYSVRPITGPAPSEPANPQCQNCWWWWRNPGSLTVLGYCHNPASPNAERVTKDTQTCDKWQTE